MRINSFRSPTPWVCVTLIAAFQIASIAAAQLPTATGRQLALSRSQWRLFVPDGYTPPVDKAVNLLVHFHGDPQTVWNNAAYAELDAVVVTVNYSGLSSAYSGSFSDQSLFQQLLDSAQVTLSGQPGFGPETAWDRLAVSSFSAGYGAVREMLKNPSYVEAIDGLLAADSLYATTAFDGTALDSQMAGYKAFADLAAAGDKRFVFTHSQVPTFTYESTAETGDELLEHLDLTPEPTSESGLGPLRYYRKAERNGFKLWGATGADGDGHLNHLRYLGEWLGDLGLTQTGLAGDYNADGVVDAADYTVWRDNWLRFNVPGDGDGDGFVGNTDYVVWADRYGESLEPDDREPVTPVPTPASAGLLGVAMALAPLTRTTPHARLRGVRRG